MEIIIICLTALAGSALTFFSGFGLGTVLLPVFGLFFPIETAVTMTAIVHFANNLFKLGLTWRDADREVVIKFGLLSFAGAIAGAILLTAVSQMGSLFQYWLGNEMFVVTPAGLIIGILLIFFALFDIMPGTRRIEIHPKYLPYGGVLSGFFGGLSGHQGALRTTFLIRAGLSKESFIATGVMIACIVDISRLTVYFPMMKESFTGSEGGLLTAAVFSAFAGALAGNKLLKKITIHSLEKFIAVLLIVFGVLLAAGIV